MKPHTQNKQAGFTYIELMIVVALLAVFITIGVPMFNDATEKNSVRSKIKLLRASLSEARALAMQKREQVVVCGSSDGATCDGASWENGWMVYIDDDGSDTYSAAEDEIHRIYSAFQDNTTVTVSVEPVIFSKTGYSDAAVEFQLCPGSNTDKFARGIVVQASGVVRYSRDSDGNLVHEDMNGSDYTCP